MLDRFFKEIDKMANRAYWYIPPFNSVWKGLDKWGQSILDLGCATGATMELIANKNKQRQFYTVGVDVWEPYVRSCKKRRTHDELILCDVRMLPFQRKSFDIVLCIGLLEHLEKEDGLELIGAMEEIARRKVIIWAPVGVHKQPIINGTPCLDGNPYQEHTSVWTPADLKRLGYKVRGYGLRNMSGREGWLDRFPKVFRPLLQYVVAAALAAPWVFFFPNLGGGMICSKSLVYQKLPQKMC